MLGINMNNIKKLQPEVQKKFVPYLESMIEIYGDEIVSVFIYGSAAAGGYTTGASDINSAFVLKDLKFSVLKKGLKTVSKGINASVAAPLFLTKEYISSSLDVFPIEFIDMKENHILVCGQDVLSGLEIRGEHIRLFCEQQIKGKLVRMRQAYLEVGLSRKGMLSLMKDSLNSLVPVFRNLIRFKGENPPVSKAEILERLSALFGLDVEVLLGVWGSRKGKKIATGDVETLAGKFMNEVEKLSVIVDKL